MMVPMALENGEITVGRENSGGLKLDDPRVSRKHAEVSLHEGKWSVLDLDSRNGTYLDGERLRRLMTRDDAQLLRIGHTLFLMMRDIRALMRDTVQVRGDIVVGPVLREVWNSIVNKNPKDTAKLKEKLGWSDRDILTMASIVEKEAADPKERPRIAQVFINRLTFSSFKPKRLETDPTIRYGCLVPQSKSPPCIAWIEACTKQGKQAGCDRLRRAQLDDSDNPYNTYQIEGLPPGPIANPGRRSMEAVVAPDGSDYLYFVAKNEREHAFSKTFDEHKRNVDKYMK